jgi:hypothetical protein
LVFIINACCKFNPAAFSSHILDGLKPCVGRTDIPQVFATN